MNIAYSSGYIEGYMHKQALGEASAPLAPQGAQLQQPAPVQNNPNLQEPAPEMGAAEEAPIMPEESNVFEPSTSTQMPAPIAGATPVPPMQPVVPQNPQTVTDPNNINNQNQ
jgi:hypothetical protein